MSMYLFLNMQTKRYIFLFFQSLHFCEKGFNYIQYLVY